MERAFDTPCLQKPDDILATVLIFAPPDDLDDLNSGRFNSDSSHSNGFAPSVRLKLHR
jgi:hypothetical protein